MERIVTKILLVDDSPTNTLLMEETLKQILDTQILTASSGKEALSLMQKNDFAVVLLDVEMPGMDGFEVVSRMRAYEKLEHVPVIFVTPQEAEKTNLFKGYESGAVDFLFKPIQTEILCSKVKVFLDLYEQKKNLELLLAEKVNLLEQVKKQNTELVALHSEKELILEHAGEGIMGLDTKGHITFVNSAALKMLGWKKKELINQPMYNFLFPESEGSFSITESDEKMAKVVKKRIGVQETKYFSFKKKDGSALPVEYTTSFLSAEKGENLGTVIIFEDVSERIESEKKLTHEASHDRLTGLPNRFLFEEVFKDMLSQPLLQGKRGALLFVDLDHFKDVNDTLGHQAGDALLKEMARRMKSAVGKSGFVSRLSGDEFTIILKEIDTLDQVSDTAQHLLDVLSKPCDLMGNKIATHASIGIAIYPEAGKTVQDLVKNADTAMYRVKKEGRNGYHFFTKQLLGRPKERLELVTDLHQALEQNEFVLHYQPQYNIQTGKLVGLEALIRWQHPKKGLLPPLTFIPIAEESGLITPIGEWVLRAAYKQYQIWRKQKLIDENVVIGVNLSSIQLLKSDLVKTIKELEKELSIKPGCLELELTETSLIGKSDSSLKALEELHKLGIRITIDDFGTGYSSLAYLKRLPVQSLKIDRSFITDVTKNKDDAAIVRGIIQLAHSLSLYVTAEGVETKEQLEFLKENHCEIAQGFYFSKPLNVEDAGKLLKNKRT